MASTLPGFAEILIRRKTISTDQFAEADQVARDTGATPEDSLVKLGYATSEEVMRAVAEEHRVEFVDIARTKIPDDVIQLVPESVARENNVMPIDEIDGVLRVAIGNPADVDTIEKLRFILNRDIRISLSPKDSIMESINRLYGQIEGESADSILQEFTDTAIDFTETEDGDFGDDDGLVDENSAPVVKLVQLMIQEAVQLRASDIHVEPFEDRVRIRYRIDGILHERDSPPRRLLGPLLSRIKIIAKIDIAERRRPQDGRIKITAGEKELDLRVSVIPTNQGQSVVMRLLDPDNIKVGIRQLGFSEKNFKEFQGLIKRPNGIILVTGPTGSGKTTTLYAALSALNRPDRKIITAEDPVEYYLPGINQVQVDHNIGLDFSRIIRSMLRMAPNIILVGEMRDAETASIGIEASLTGHLVFSTLHTNDAPSAVTRMIDMGVPGYLVASSVIAIMAQRLVRTICPKCRQKYKPSDEVLAESGFTEEQLENASFMRGKGCNHCNKSGFKGRIGIYELMTVNGKIRELIFAGASTTEIRKLAIKQDMSTLYIDGMDKVLKGITTLEEVYRVAKKTEQDA
ncbi:MAG: GspE/PulE family protein [Planctomycetota bacterium]|nr:GspE/PulE family protein [Planctomycetota bacterium]